ncbi:ATP-binding protein [Iningainema tapete]|uniref:histidine kinase n=1 Tax=Iningainema tapete BLCC-T55 TaxID=2748662 RepID=A0A8J6XKK0_9CYAN|nr:ATP-binding protein [Iningainema tapete]MBD2774326.1 GAF domain-containing protein [Iningainema tapete BLCC-T55]
MSQSEDISAQIAHLANYQYKPIHTPGSIQPHGVLLALSLPELNIRQLSKNTQKYLGKQPKDLLSQPLSSLFDASQVEAIKKYLMEDGSINYFKLSRITMSGEQHFDGIVHRTQGVVILEIEPTINTNGRDVTWNVSTQIRGAIARIRSSSHLTELLNSVAVEVRKITDFDRVLIYQFDHVGAGAVVAEAKREDLSSYLGLHYPATDIPAPARELYKRGLLRVIPNLNAQPIELLPIENPLIHQPLDLSLSVLRSVDPCCIEYHQNMGCSALMVISIIENNQLWGLISCHHQTPKYVPYEIRMMSEFMAQIVSSELASRISHEELEYRGKLKSLQSEIIQSISQAENFVDALIEPDPSLLDLLNAEGVVVCLDSKITLVGKTPNVSEIRALIEWADTQVKDNLFCTDSLPKLYPPAQAFKDTASGLLLLRISQVKRYYVLWFRPEVIQIVNWAGEPNEAIQVMADGSLNLSPRRSFAQWKETVRFTSLPWQQTQINSAIDFRNAIVGTVLNKAEELARINQELSRSNQELASFAYAASHDLKEPLRGIHNYSVFMLEDYAEVLDDAGIDRLNTLVRLSQRMETLIDVLLRFSQLGQTQLHLTDTNLNQLIKRVMEMFRASRLETPVDIRIPRTLPKVQCDPVLINEVFSNIIINAFKYNDKAEKWIEIGYLDPNEQISQGLAQPSQTPVFYVRDNGIGIREQHRETIFRLFKRLHSQKKYGGGTGAGLAIAKKIVERHGGRIWVESTYGEGSTFYFSLG